MQRCEYFFFFQAEDGIRDHAQSRGLGDVYKRQEYMHIGEEKQKNRIMNKKRKEGTPCSQQENLKNSQQTKANALKLHCDLLRSSSACLPLFIIIISYRCRIYSYSGDDEYKTVTQSPASLHDLSLMNYFSLIWTVRNIGHRIVYIDCIARPMYLSLIHI
eukprot:TRINITY_DN4067_c0_g1_i3.p1 TRINITY_DN4067_c0_g1~~TRINITY_DN4067_c0_g1_i3.p1  ORF type:complete len:160 (+),score=17.61 TRINITY_DN4067_c0_g1_i3:1-480(+)